MRTFEHSRFESALTQFCFSFFLLSFLLFFSLDATLSNQVVREVALVVIFAGFACEVLGFFSEFRLEFWGFLWFSVVHSLLPQEL